MPDIAKFIDHTLLKPESTQEDIIKLCDDAKAYNFASVCINPCWVEIAKKNLEGSTVKVCTVIGFPLGASLPVLKLHEAEVALATGAEEIDVVINVGRVKMQDESYLYQEINGIVNLASSYKAITKIIIETALLSDVEKIFAAKVSVNAGANYVKTSTGFSKGGATIQDIVLLRSIVGENIGVKASGGIKNLSDTLSMIKAGASRIGTSSGVSIMQELKGGNQNA